MEYWKGWPRPPTVSIEESSEFSDESDGFGDSDSDYDSDDEGERKRIKHDPVSDVILDHTVLGN